MPSKLNVYNLGQEGINRVKAPVQVKDGELIQSQNATVKPILAQLALSKRDGMAKANLQEAAGTILAIANLPVADPDPDAVDPQPPEGATIFPETGLWLEGGVGNWVANGGADFADMIQDEGDAKSLEYLFPISGSNIAAGGTFDDDGVTIPAIVTITSVTARCTHKTTNGFAQPFFIVGATSAFYEQDFTGIGEQPLGTSYTEWTSEMALNPDTGLAWTRANLFGTTFSIVAQDTGSATERDTYEVDQFYLEVEFS